MAQSNLAPSETKVSITSYESIEGVEYFLIRVACWHEKEWTVRQRFKSFVELHEKLQSSIAISKDLLPGKKILKNSKFLEQRRADLEKYLKTVTTTVQQLPVIPLELIQFLDFHRYDVLCLLQNMALEISWKPEEKSAKFTILELHAISERLRLPCPSFQFHDSSFDFSHIVDFCSQLISLTIVPSKKQLVTKEEFLQELICPIGTSNILSSTLNLELKPFTSIKTLCLLGVVPQNISCDPVRASAVNIIVNFTRAQNIQQILLPEMIHDGSISDSSFDSFLWLEARNVNFASNDIWTIDKCMRLVPKVEELHLNDNRLRTIANLSSLHTLNHLNLSGNLIESVNDWQLELGNIETLNLSGNKLKDLKGLGRLRSLRTINLSWNQIDDFEQIDEIAKLPIVDNVLLNGNPLILEVDYRAKVFSRFDERCCEILLDNEKCSQNEMDKALVLSALRKTKIR